MNKSPIVSLKLLEHCKKREEDKYKDIPLNKKTFGIRLPIIVQPKIDSLTTGQLRSLITDALLGIQDNSTDEDRLNIQQLHLEIEDLKEQNQVLQEENQELKERIEKLVSALQVLRRSNQIFE